jgi:glycosyltransferase involved in cell wall biosynthesis
MVLGLDSDKYDARVCYLSGRPDGKNVLDRYQKSIYLETNADSRTLSFSAINSIKNLLKQEMPAIIHCHRHRATNYGVLACKGIHGNTAIISHVHGLGRTRTLKRRMSNWYLFKYVYRIIAVSQGVRTDVLQSNWGIIPEKVDVLYNGINLEPIDSILTNKEQARTLIGASSDEMVFGSVGRLVPTKGHIYLIEAFEKVRKVFPNSRLVIIGEGPLSDELKEKARKTSASSQISFLGYRKDVLELLKGLDVFVFPSLAEGLGLALIEAMGSRIPAIASKAGGIPEAFGQNKCGILVPAKDINSLAEAMKEIAHLDQEKRKIMGNAARARIEEAFTTDTMSKGLMDIYESVIAS